MASHAEARALGPAAHVALWRPLARIPAIAVPVAVPLIVSPWGEGYNQVKAITMGVLAAVTLLLWGAARFGQGRRAWTLTAPEIPLWLFLAAALLSTAVSSDPRLSFLGAPRRHEGLFVYGAYAALFFAGVHLFGSLRGMRTLMRAASAGASAAIIYGLAQVVLPPLFPGEAFIRSWYGGLGVPRLFSTLGSPIVFGGYLAVMLPLLLALAITAPGRIRHACLGAACLGLAAAVLTLTRAAWLAILAGTAIFWPLLGRPVLRRSRLAAAAYAAAALAAVIIALSVVASPAAIGERVVSSVDVSSGSLGTRLYMWSKTVEMIQARPLLGWGLETLGTVFPYDRPALVRLFGMAPVIIDRAHNDVLQVAVSVGIPGAAAYLAFWLLVIGAAARVVRGAEGEGRVLAAGCLAAVAAFLIQLQFSFSSVALSPMVWLLAGAACGWQAAGHADEGHDA